MTFYLIEGTMGHQAEEGEGAGAAAQTPGPDKVRALRENRVSLRAIAKTTGVATSVVRSVLGRRSG